MIELGASLSEKDYLEINCTPYREDDAVYVNDFFGILGINGSLSSGCLPTKIDATNLWQQAKTVVSQVPAEREVFIGWDVVGDALRITEITLGEDPEAIQQTEEDIKWNGKKLGKCTAKAPHLLDFHTHPYESLSTAKNSRDYKFKNTPATRCHDHSPLVLSPAAYARVIVNNDGGEIFGGRVLIALKTTNALKVTRENYRQQKHRLIYELYRGEIWGMPKYSLATLPFCSPSPNMVEDLRFDEYWQNWTGLSFYRGKVRNDPSKPSFAYRWDEYYRRFMGVNKRKKFFF